MGLTTRTHRTFASMLLMIWVVVVFVFEGLSASPVRDHNSISQDSELQQLVDHRIITRRETSALIDDSLASSHNIREGIRPDPGPSVVSRTSSHKSLTPSQQLRRSALSARSSLIDISKRRKPLPIIRNHLDIKKSRKQAEITTTTISSLNGNTLDEFELLPLDNDDYYYDLDGEAILLEEMLDTTTGKVSVTETTPAPIEFTQTTSSKSTSTVTISSSNRPVETTESTTTPSKTSSKVEASTESTSETPILSTHRSVTASIHASTSPAISTTPLKTTVVTPRSFRYTTLKPGVKKDPASLLLNRIRDRSSTSRTSNSEMSPLNQSIERLSNKAKTLKEHHVTEPLQIHLLSDQLVVQISGTPKVTSQRESRAKFKSTSSSTSSVGGSPLSVSTSSSSAGGSSTSKSARNIEVSQSSSPSNSNADDSTLKTTPPSSLDSSTSKPSTTKMPMITTSTKSSLEPDVISEKNVEASRKSQSHSVSTSAVRFEVHTTAESSPVPTRIKNNAKPSAPIELIRQHGASPLGLSPFGSNPVGPMPFGSNPIGQHPFGLHPHGLPKQNNITKEESTTTPKSIFTTTSKSLPSTVNITSKPNSSSTTTTTTSTTTTTTTSKPETFPIPNPTTNEKVGYVVAEENQSRFQLEQVTKDGFIIGEFGTVNHTNGNVNGVRYTADGSVDHKLIHEALQRFLSL